MEYSEDFTLEQIAGIEDFIISDSSPIRFSGERDNWFRDELFDTYSYIDMQQDTLERASQEIDLIHNWFCRPNVTITDLVLVEIQRFGRILDKKQRKLYNHTNNMYPFNPGEVDLATKNMKAFTEIIGKYHEAAQCAANNVFQPGDQDFFDKIMEEVVYIAKIEKSKHDFNRKYGKRQGQTYSLATDEQIVSAAIYSATIDGKSTGIVTVDSDIQNIAIPACADMASKGPVLQKLLSDNPIRVYFAGTDSYGTEQKYNKKLDSLNPEHISLHI
ncbi:hypothetical protein HQ545_03610 [Candidatus Woesearchaeota archaeon]|nr:hypothetical protein [Candidatus Woesearchaeota archaeon]